MAEIITGFAQVAYNLLLLYLVYRLGQRVVHLERSRMSVRCGVGMHEDCTTMRQFESGDRAPCECRCHA